MLLITINADASWRTRHTIMRVMRDMYVDQAYVTLETIGPVPCSACGNFTRIEVNDVKEMENHEDRKRVAFMLVVGIPSPWAAMF